MRSEKYASKKRFQFPPLIQELQPHIPTVELIGRMTVIVSRHHGLTEYTAQKICAESSEGRICVSGSGLTVTQMNSQTLTVRGRISSVTYAEERE